jgi:hypothetical protein
MFEFDILETEDFIVKNKGVKTFVPVSETESLSVWIKEGSIKPKGNNLPVFSSIFNTKNKVKPFGESLGYCYFTANRVEYNQQFVSLFTTPFSVSRGFYINKDNFMNTLVAYSSRSLINNTIWNANDEYKRPKTESDKFKQFNYDSLIINLFSNGSGQASYRNFEHLGETYNIKNEFFWMSVDKMKQLSEEKNYDNLFNDARTDSDRYVHNLLFGEQRIYDELSPEAKSVLDYATYLVEQSIEFRQFMANDDNHLDAWDVGYAQLKLVWKEYLPNQFKEFRELYKKLEDSMRPLVYELGFLVK